MKYWKLLLVIPVILLFIAGCGSIIKYDISLDKVSVLSPIKIDLTDVVKDDLNKYTFTDERVKIKWFLYPSQLDFNLLNKTSDSIEIIWDKSAYIDIDNRTHRLIHAGTKFIDRNNSQQNTVVIPNTSVDDNIYPSDYVYFVSGQYGGWRQNPLFLSNEDVDQLINRYVGKNVQALLAIKIGNDIYNYVFTFKINDCKVQQ